MPDDQQAVGPTIAPASAPAESLPARRCAADPRTGPDASPTDSQGNVRATATMENICASPTAGPSADPTADPTTGPSAVPFTGPPTGPSAGPSTVGVGEPLAGSRRLDVGPVAAFDRSAGAPLRDVASLPDRAALDRAALDRAAPGGAAGGVRPGRLGGWLTAVASLVGLASFLYPFIVPAIQRATTGQARAGEAPLVFAAVTMLCVLAIVADLDPMRSGANASKLVAMLAALVAIDAMLRLVPAFLGASPVFLLILLGGYVYGPRFGFQLGALTLLVSAFVTGGIGPWLPYQMLGAGWVGLSAGWLPHPAERRQQIVLLAAFGALWGLLFGALLNVWFWPVAAPGGEVSAGLSWSPDLSVGEALRRYAAFYVTTSLWYDAFRAVGNVVLVVVLGGPILRTLERYRSRLTWEWRPA